jgi:hypothetical protein
MAVEGDGEAEIGSEMIAAHYQALQTNFCFDVCHPETL